MDERDLLVRGRLGTLATITLALFLTVGCVGRSSSSCEDMCYAQAGNCGADAESCLSRCRPIAAVAEHLGCQSAHGELLACAASYSDLCSSVVADLCVVEQRAYQTCLLDVCRDDPTGPLCTDVCEERCREAYAVCGGGAECDEGCGPFLRNAASRGCGSETWDLMRCGFEQLEIGECSPTCTAQSEVVLSCLGEPTTPSTPTVSVAQYYEGCDDRACSEGTCRTLRTSTTSGSLCTAECYDTADCPGHEAVCLPLEGGGGLCVLLCGYSPCGAGTICRYDSYYGVDICVPDI